MPSVYCTKCGHANPEDARFCSRCGSPLTRYEASGDTTSTISVAGIEAYEAETGEFLLAERALVEQLEPGTALLTVIRGPNAGSRFKLDRDLTTVGRHPESTIFLDDITVSRRHVEFYRHPGGRFTIRDVGSLNGTYVNRERIEEAPLHSGDEVQIGKFRLVFLTRSNSGA
ncbi:FHA domain-containing protein [Thermoactinospora rubra]|uniref:FHA domain-containing protein n=1 Tax=Thermoactinospora rubra TaxID=1088767 RepID=UPI000A101349|nr:FHA domain-containing protein [Thermoactinospora rubra]